MSMPPKTTQAEYLKLPHIEFTNSRVQIAAINQAIKLQRLSHRWDKRLSVQKLHAAAQDGYQIPLLHISAKAKSEPRPVVLYYHGGAFFLTFMVGHLKLIERYVLEAQVDIVLVDYRLSTKHPFPVPVQDSYDALNWVHDNADVLGVDETRLAVMGDSAGGALSAVMCQKSLDESGPLIKSQFLIYPVADADMKTKSATAFVDARMWNPNNNRIMWELYLANQEAGRLPGYASPIHRENFKGLPQAYVETADLDPLRDEGMNYAKALEHDGVRVQSHHVMNAIHGFDYAKMCAPIRDVLDKRISCIKSMLVDG